MFFINNENSLNTKKGQIFQKQTAELLKNHFQIPFVIETKIQIGNPSKDHKFDLTSDDSKYVIECKSYSWTKEGNVPSAKMGHVNEAVFYLSFLPHNKERYVALRKATHDKRSETLAEYYYRTYKHLLNDIKILEIDVDNNRVKEINY